MSYNVDINFIRLENINMAYKKNFNKKIVNKTPNKIEYILFLDETDPNNGSEYFCLSGIIVKRNEYEDVIIKNVNKLKEKHFGNSSIVFHYTEMKNNIREFKIFKDAIISENRNFFGFFISLFTNKIELINIPICAWIAIKNRINVIIRISFNVLRP